MMSRARITWAAIAAAIALFGAASAAGADEGGWGRRAEISLLGGIQALNENDTALPDRFLAIPAVVTATYHLSPLLAVEGEFTWMLPVEQSVDVGGAEQDLRTPDILAYQANLRASWPGASFTPYLAAGAGAVTFLSNDDPDRYPQLDESQTAFAINFGGGLTYGLNDRWALRADVRELVAFPSDDAVGLSQGGTADEVWMERGTLGLVYRF